MWLPTTIGFFSAVLARKGDGSKGQPVDPDRFMIRARTEQHLENLRERFPEQLADVEVFRSLHSDYPVRFFISREAWTRIVVGLVDDVDYADFKSAVAARKKTGPAYIDALHSVWAVFRNLQSRLRRGAQKLEDPSGGEPLDSLPFEDRGSPEADLRPGETPSSHDEMVEPCQVGLKEEAAVLSLQVNGQKPVPIAIAVGLGPWTDAFDEPDLATDVILVQDMICWGMIGAVEVSRVHVSRLPWEAMDERLHALPCFDVGEAGPLEVES